MPSFHFQKPLVIRKNNPIEIQNEKEELVGTIEKISSRISFQNNNPLYSYTNEAVHKELATLTVEIGWLGEDGSSVVYHNIEPHFDMSFKEIPSSNHSLHIKGMKEDHRIDIIQSEAKGPIKILLDHTDTCHIAVDKSLSGSAVSIEYQETEILPPAFFLLSFFIIKLIKEEF
ncbi:hypothetical protein PWEIH_02961 [Listeria weihenstephanensis FSL R9-0317]|uniref:Uncharacterized protein n=1 Tax=Listeria weihenstephanensis TaxID=1006155 RepID=A0A1S7FWU5_9LIST|nr:hypothetical protein [Listeria weihenstephanensis]AQY51908.1 hypothetical protein UE46_13320 [Listeria weihenstephanensis]EUJ40703.1 hypothetical protein PWEIH_02961 [Listeria weihenstephanensis FSL R9-0317]MBC1499236.1 hypothetical protein [Listeria weihenstephanensis]